MGKEIHLHRITSTCGWPLINLASRLRCKVDGLGSLARSHLVESYLFYGELHCVAVSDSHPCEN